MQQQLMWRTEAGPALVAEVGSVRLVVRSVGGYARFLVLRSSQAAAPASPALVASGTATHVHGAMMAAERRLDQFEISGPADPTRRAAAMPRL